MIIEVEIINIKSILLGDWIAPSLTHYFPIKISDLMFLFTRLAFEISPLRRPISEFLLPSFHSLLSRFHSKLPFPNLHRTFQKH